MPKIDDAARRAEITWRQIEAASQKSDPGLIQPGPVSVIGNNGPNPSLMAKVEAIRSEDNWRDEMERCFASLLQLADRSNPQGTDHKKLDRDNALTSKIQDIVRENDGDMDAV